MEVFLDTKQGKLDFAYELAKKIDCNLPVFVCIGSDRVVSDMIGPLTAEYLVNKFGVRAYVYGRLKNPIVASNLESAFEFIRKEHKDKQIIIIDATLGELNSIGKIKLISGGCVPAGAFGYNRNLYGDLSILAVVNTFGIDAKQFLSCAKFNEVYTLAGNLAESIDKALKISSYVREEVV